MCEASAYRSIARARSDAPTDARRPPPAPQSSARGAVQRDDIDDFGHAARQRAGFVERHAADRAGPFEVRTAFDQHAFARGARQRGHDRHRRRNNQRARARDDQQHQRAIDPASQRRTEGQRRNDGDRERQRDDRRRVDAREPLDECLRGRPLRLRLLDEVDDARERRVPSQPRDPDVERAAAVDAAGKHFVARRLVDRQRFACDRRLVDRALPADHRAIDRNLFAGPDHDDSAGRIVSTGRFSLAVAAHQRLGRREIHQRAHREPRALERSRFERLRDGKQKDNGGGFIHWPSTIAPAAAIASAR